MKPIYIYGQCEECGTCFEGNAQIDHEGKAQCPNCSYNTHNYNDEGWNEEKPDKIIKIKQ